MTLGQQLKSKRKELNLKQKDVAIAINVSERYIIFIEKDERTPSFKVLKEICKLYKMDSLPIC